MIEFLKRHWISISLLLVALIIGVVQYLKETPIDIWLVEYEFESSVQEELPDFTQSDTVFQHKEIFCRNYVGSIGDTLTESGIRRFELKMYLPQSLKIDAQKMRRDVLASPYINVIKDQFKESQKNRQKLLYWIIFGLLLVLIAEFLVSLKKKPSTN